MIFTRQFRFVVPRRCFLEQLKKSSWIFLSFVGPVSLSEHSFANSSWLVLRRNCFSVTLSATSFRQYTVQPGSLSGSPPGLMVL